MKNGSKKYKALLDEALELHLKKNQGYAADNPDAFANFRLAEGLGLTAEQGVAVRMGDKFARVQSLMSNPDNDKVGESLRDTLMDLSAYALILICLMEERERKADPDKRECCPVGCIVCTKEVVKQPCPECLEFCPCYRQPVRYVTCSDNYAVHAWDSLCRNPIEAEGC